MTAASNIQEMIAEEERQKLEEAKREEIEILKKSVLARGGSVDAIIAETIKKNPELLDKFLADVMEEEDVLSQLSKHKEEELGPPSVLNSAEAPKPDLRRGCMLERASGKRQVRAAARDSVTAPSGIQPGTYHTALRDL